MGRLKVDLNDQASKEITDIAKSLKITESEVLGKGIAIMRMYADANKDGDAKLLLQEGNQSKELRIKEKE